MTIRTLLAITTVVVMTALPAGGQQLLLSDVVLPKGLEAYADAANVATAATSAANLLRDAQLTPDPPRALVGYYVDAEYPKLRWDEQKKELVRDRSPCEADFEVMAIHRGWAWIAVAYNIFARTIEGRDVDGPKYVENKPSNQSIDLHITRHGRTTLLRVLQVGSIASSISHAAAVSKLSIEARRDVVAFLRALLAFKAHHDLLVARGDSIHDWMTRARLFQHPTAGSYARDLITRINALLPAGTASVSSCLEGYAWLTATLKDGRTFQSGSIYSNGIAMYAVGFWWRREGEGTSSLADGALRYMIKQLQR